MHVTIVNEIVFMKILAIKDNHDTRVKLQVSRKLKDVTLRHMDLDCSPMHTFRPS